MTQEEAVARRIERLVDGRWEAVRTCERAEGRDPWLEARLVHAEARQNWGRDNVQVIEVFRTEDGTEDDYGCEGHNDFGGETFYCDGTCRTGALN